MSRIFRDSTRNEIRDGLGKSCPDAGKSSDRVSGFGENRARLNYGARRALDQTTTFTPWRVPEPARESVATSEAKSRQIQR